MNLIWFELKKLRADKLPTILLLLSLCAVLLFACVQAKPIVYDRKETAHILDLFQNSPAETYRTWQEKQQAYRAYLDGEGADELLPFLSDYDAYRHAWEQFSRQTRYRDRLETVLRQTRGEDPVSVYQSALYRKNQALKLSHDDMQLLPNLFQTLSFASALTLALSALLGITVAYTDRRHGTEPLLFATPRGRIHTRVAKLSAICLCSACIGAVLFSSALFPFACQNGFLAWDAYLQNHENFFVCPYPISVYRAVLVLFLLTWLGAFSFGAAACLIGKVISRQVVALPLAALPLIAFGTSAWFVTPDGRSLLHLVSPFAFCDGRVAFGHLYGVRLGTFAVGGLIPIACAWALLCASLCAVYLFRHTPAARSSKSKRRSFALPSLRVPRWVGTVGSFEVFKQCICNKALVLFVPLLLLFAWQISPTLTPDQSYTEQTYCAYMQKLQGAYTPQKQSLVDNALAEAQGVLAQKQEMDTLFASGAITQAEMSSYMRRFGNAKAQEEALQRVADRLDKIRNLPDAAIVYDSGWNRFFSLRWHIFPLLTICAVCCGLFADEHKHGMHRLFPPSARRRIARAKYAFAVCFALIAALCFETASIAMVAHRFVLALPFAPSLSVSAAQIFGTAPLLYAAGMSVMLRLLGYTAVAFVCALCSRLLRQKHAAFVCGMLSALPFLWWW